MTKFYLTMIGIVSATAASAGAATVPVSVPEISAIAGTSAIAGLGAVMAITLERRRKNKD